MGTIVRTREIVGKKRSDPNALARIIPGGNWWDWKIFPYCSRNPLDHKEEYAIKPCDLARALGTLASSTKSIKTILEEMGMSNGTFTTLRKRFPMVEVTYREAMKAKADMFGSEAIDCFQKAIPDEFWQIDKMGNKVLSMAGVRYLEAKSTAMFKSASIAEAGTYQAKTQIESRNLNMNVNSNLELKDIMSMGIDGLMKPND